jgi:hypothetical protein
MATNPNMVAIQTVTVGSGGAASIEFTSIPATFTDLLVKTSSRGTNAAVTVSYVISFNGSITNFTNRVVGADGSTTFSYSNQPRRVGITAGASATASTFGNGEIYIPNYAGSNNKSYSADAVGENNATTADSSLFAGLWSDSSAITSITITPEVANFAEHSTATLYGVTSAAVGAKATGGIISQDADYFYHTFPASGTFTPTSNITADFLVVAGGGGAGSSESGCDTGTGGAGAGGFRTATSQSFTNGTAYTLTVGAGGAGGTAKGNGTKGGNSSIAGTAFSTFTCTGGGNSNGQLGSPSFGPNTGGSGSGRPALSGSVGAGNEGGFSPPEGNDGALGNSDGVNATGAGGGGGAGAAGSDGGAGTFNGGNGGIGSSTSISGGSTTGFGELSGGDYYFAGGGGGGAGRTTANKGTGGLGGGGDSGGNTVTNGTSADTNTGGGGGGGTGSVGSNSTGGAGGSGIVIVRYAK